MFEHSIIQPFGPSSRMCEKCGVAEDKLTGDMATCFLAKRPGEDRKRHRKDFEGGK